MVDDPVWGAPEAVVASDAIHAKALQEKEAANVVRSSAGLKGSGRKRIRTKQDEDEDEVFWNEEKGAHLIKDVKYYLYLARKRVLRGLHLLFSGIFPVNTVPEQ